jgi:hypothetical protein
MYNESLSNLATVENDINTYDNEHFMSYLIDDESLRCEKCLLSYAKANGTKCKAL